MARIAFLLLLAFPLFGQSGWSQERLNRALAYADSLDTAALMVVHKGHVVVDWGDTSARYNAQSIRKSLLNALFGIAVGRGQVSPNATLAQLRIDDTGGLTAREKQARVSDLLMSRSGVYHSALYEVDSNRKSRPARGEHRPGEFFYYNNWDFNALGTIYERRTKTPIGVAFEREIAKPLGMQDFRAEDVVYLTKESLTEKAMHSDSDHRAYVFMISARDLARFGQLYLTGGVWKGKQIVPKQWIAQSFQGKPAAENVLYGYLWWIYPKSEVLADAGVPGTMYVARGFRGHRLYVIPHLDLVIVHRVATGGVGLFAQLKRRFFGSGEVEGEELAKLMTMIVSAHPKAR